MRGMNRFRLPADRNGAAVLLGAVLLALGALWAASQPSTTGEALAGLGLLALAGIRAGAGAQAFATANRLTGAATGKAWRFLTTSWVLAALSALLLWGGWALVGQAPQVPSLADLLLLAGSSCALWAVASYGAGPKERFGRLRNWLDVAILLVSGLGLSWLALPRAGPAGGRGSARA